MHYITCNSRNHIYLIISCYISPYGSDSCSYDLMENLKPLFILFRGSWGIEEKTDTRETTLYSLRIFFICGSQINSLETKLWKEQWLKITVVDVTPFIISNPAAVFNSVCFEVGITNTSYRNWKVAYSPRHKSWGPQGPCGNGTSLCWAAEPGYLDSSFSTGPEHEPHLCDRSRHCYSEVTQSQNNTSLWATHQRLSRHESWSNLIWAWIKGQVSHLGAKRKHQGKFFSFSEKRKTQAECNSKAEATEAAAVC